MKGVVFFHNSSFLIKSSLTLHWCPHLQCGEWKKQLRKGLPGFDRQKVAKRKFLCSNAQSLKVLSTKISGLLMFSEIGKLRVRRSFSLLELRSVFKDYDVQRVQSHEERLEDLNSLFFPWTSGFQNLSRKWLIRRVAALCFIHCNVNCKEWLSL